MQPPLTMRWVRTNAHARAHFLVLIEHVQKLLARLRSVKNAHEQQLHRVKLSYVQQLQEVCPAVTHHLPSVNAVSVATGVGRV
jgi:hypothetical protein